MLRRIVSGGQTGVDRAALDVALELGIDCGGWCPLGRKAEDGRVPMVYPLRETPSREYRVRTEWNVRESDATLVLTWGPAGSGTGLTINLAQWLDKPLLVLDLGEDPDPGLVCDWLGVGGYEVLNVAGPRESLSPGIHALAREFLRAVLSPCRPPDSAG